MVRQTALQPISECFRTIRLREVRFDVSGQNTSLLQFLGQPLRVRRTRIIRIHLSDRMTNRR